MLAALVALLASLVWLIVVFVPLEWAFPNRADQRPFRPAWRTDLAFLVSGYLLWNGLALAASAWVSGLIVPYVPTKVHTLMAFLPAWAQVILAIVATDLFLYWGHRLQHQLDFLWRFHAVHHTPTHLDWLAAHREHPLDTVYTSFFLTLPGMALGVPASAMATVLLVRGVWSIFLHSNVDLHIGPLELLVGSPSLHRRHHAAHREPGNYANLSPMMDVAFGTHVRGAPDDVRYGVDEPAPQRWIPLLLWPFRFHHGRAPTPPTAPTTGTSSH